MQYKQRIRQFFNKASCSYDSVSVIQKQSAEFLVEKFLSLNKNFHPKKIVDLGTGTGYIVELLLKYYPDSTYLLNDIAYKMLEKCKLKFANKCNITFLHSDMEVLDLEEYDLITSNLALQWTNDILECINMFSSKSKIFAFSTLLKGTFREWQDVVNLYSNISVLKQYPEKNEIVKSCENMNKNSDFIYWTKDFCITFDNYLHFIRYLKDLGANFSDQNLPLNIVRNLFSLKTTPFTVTYKIFFGIFKKDNK